MPKNVLYYCESPFQLYIAKKLENFMNGKIIYRYKRPEDQIAVDKSVLIIRGWNPIDNLKLMYHVVKANSVISGSFKSRYLKYILFFLNYQRNTKYFDDGTASIEADDKIRKNFIYSFFIKDIEYEYTFEIKNNINCDDQQSWFIGQNISEVGLIEESEYFLLLERWWKKTEGKHRYYFPHRREAKEKLTRIKYLYPRLVFVEYQELCIEQFIENKGSLAESIFGIASSCLVTIPKLFGDTAKINIPDIIKLNEKSPHYRKIATYLLDLNERNEYAKF